MTAQCLEAEHHICKDPVCYLVSITLVGDIIILAETTEKVAMSKEYCPGTMMAYQRRFFPEMRHITGNHRAFTSFTSPNFTR
jgi:hypothetical protein